MKEHFKINHRLSWVFKVCKQLGIDDPCCWMDTVDPVVVDRWIAYEIHESELKHGDSKKQQSPAETLKALKAL